MSTMTVGIVGMSGTDTLTINNQLLSDFADGSCIELTFPNEIANVKTGKNGNAIFGLNTTGLQCELKVRILRNSPDDQFLNNLMNQQNSNFAGFPLMIGVFTKQIGSGANDGSATGGFPNTPGGDTYNLSGGIFTKQPEAKFNVEGDTEQSLTIWMMKFAVAYRILS